MGSWLLWLIILPIITPFNRIFNGLRFKNKKVLKRFKKIGFIICCNHVHTFDALSCARAVFPHKADFLTLSENTTDKRYGWFIKNMGGIPLGKTPRERVDMLEDMADILLIEKRPILILPEGHLIRFCPEVREFHGGAAHLALKTGVPIIPAAIVYRLSKNRKKLLFSLEFSDPIFPEGTKAELNDKIRDKIVFLTRGNAEAVANKIEIRNLN